MKMNEETTRILEYLSRIYRIQNNKFIKIESDNKVYGEHIHKSIITIFSVSETISEELIKNWAILNGLDEDRMNDAWRRYHFTGLPYEPKRVNRFLVTFPEEFGLQQWVNYSASRPSMYFKTKKFLGFTYYKKIKWEPIEFNFRDPIGPSTSQALYDLITDDNLKPFNFKIELLDPTGGVVERWNIMNTTIKSIDFGHLSMDDDEMANCKMVVEFTVAHLLF
jgi:predicted nucleic-acid-binding Zn-ribbon protein